MQRHELDVVTVVEDLLGAVAVVVVDVEHGHLATGARCDVLGDHGGVVEEAVAAVRGPGRVVTGRPAQPVRDRSPPSTWSAAVSATSTDDRAAAYVPCVSGVVVSKHHHPSRMPMAVGSVAGPMPSRSAGSANTSGTTSWVSGWSRW